MQVVHIIPYTSEYQINFQEINQSWVEKYFSIEPFDLEQLQNPETSILGSGGAILLAKEGDRVVGTVGLKFVDEGLFEMIKMAVVPDCQGRGIGRLLADAIILEAKRLGGKKLQLYSNTKLIPALELYRSLGFSETKPECGKYLRCDIKMELDL
ncbi:acetyltransferase [Belliella baltica DSM 15883]|uniref:Acetyltransferase n=1 Tax=Belliella baltica (strain DSM 15883 / CIP 108006 / LMG 21964 / BA134) TaxID=866536 RepID=I3Z0Z3_BELBD|nr:GNAT family N-acetyltransferase [Belliella baltica]AFL82911.1 acetyltransferase [Belliella baltica DSM 15883]